MISVKWHNRLDYLFAAALFFAPFFLGFWQVGAARNVFMLSGFLLAMYSLFTNYDFAILRVIPLGVHMTLDAVLAVFLIISPWVLDYRTEISPFTEYAHYAAGLAFLAFVGLTAEKTEVERRIGKLVIRHQRPVPAYPGRV